MFKPSQAQINYFEALQNSKDNLILEAVAGAGKTTTLIQGLEHMSGNVALCAYNRKIADEIKGKIGFKPGIFVNTLHGFGRRAWLGANPDCQVDEAEKWKLVHSAIETPKQLQSIVEKLTSFAKDQALGICKPVTDKQSWLDIFEHNNMIEDLCNSDGDLPPNVSEIIDQIMRLSFKALKQSVKLAPEIIDFGDMVYMPLIADCQLYKFSYVLIDEAQDTNPARRMLAKKMLKREGRLIAVGDPHQAIYGFTGADNDSLDIIKREFNCRSLPLSVSFRCSKAVVALARQYVDHILPCETAQEGSTSSIHLSELLNQDLKASDAILCRNTSPLVETAYTLLRAGIPCHVEGKSIGEGLIKLVDRWVKPKTIGAYMTTLDRYVDKQAKRLSAPDKAMQLESLLDRVETLKVIAEGLPLDLPLSALKTKIAALFVDTTGNKSETLTLSTIHKSKGREWNTVYWLGANRYQPSPYAKLDWQQDQEINLCYVAITRAKEHLISVIVPPKPREY